MSAPIVFAGERPRGSCPAEERYTWAHKTFDDVGAVTFTVFVGWLIDDETRTTDPALAGLIEEAIKAKVSQRRASAGSR